MSADLSVIQRAVLRALPTLGLRPGARVLDAPCGAGALARALREAGLEVGGADIETTAAATLGAAFRRCNLEEPLPWDDQTFDAVFVIEGIEHLENQFRFLGELHRVLRPGATLVITTPNITNLRSRVRFLWSGFHTQDPRPLREAARHPLHHIGLRTFPELRYTLVTSGFRIRSVGHARFKPASLAYGILAPLTWLYTRLAFRKEKDAAQRLINAEVLRQMHSYSLLFGQNLMLVAERV